MKVAHLTSLHRRYDTRVYLKECISIAAAGYETYLVVADGKGDEDTNGVKIIDIGKRSRIRLIKFFISSRNIYKKALDLNCDIYHFHDPELMFVGLFLKKRNKKVIFDIHENVAEQIKSKEYIPFKLIRYGVSYLYKCIENSIVKSFDALITVTDGVASYLNHKKIIIVRNLPVLNLIKNIQSDQNSRISSDTPFTLIYPGSLSRVRGVFDLVKAMHPFKGSVKLELYGRWQSESLRVECESHPGWEHVMYGGVLKPDEIYKKIKNSNLGVHIVHDISNHDDSLPVKVLEFMACEVPCLVSETKTHRNIFGDNVYYVKPNSPNSLIEAINYIKKNQKESDKKIRNSNLFIANNSWEIELKKLLDLYKNL